MDLRTRMAQLVGLSAEDRALDALERQAAALERLVQLAEIALGVDPPTIQAAAEAAAAPPPPPGTVEIGQADRAAIAKIEEITLSLAAVMGRAPSDEEIHAELDRQEAVEAAAAERAAQWGRTDGRW